MYIKNLSRMKNTGLTCFMPYVTERRRRLTGCAGLMCLSSLGLYQTLKSE